MHGSHHVYEKEAGNVHDDARLVLVADRLIRVEFWNNLRDIRKHQIQNQNTTGHCCGKHVHHSNQVEDRRE